MTKSRLTGIILKSCTNIIGSIFGPDNPDLPPIDEKILSYYANGATVDWSDEQTAINYMVGGWRLLAGSKHDFGEKRAYKLATEEVNRANNLLSMFNHALLEGGNTYYDRIKEINVPALVIHGTEDPVLPYDHGVALANEIPNAALKSLEGTEHEIHYVEWDTVVDNYYVPLFTEKDPSVCFVTDGSFLSQTLLF